MLTETCGLSERPASEVSASLQRYTACKPAKLHAHVLHTLTLKELMQCFDLGTRIGRVELCEATEGSMAMSATPPQDIEAVSLVLKKDISDSALSDIG